MRLTSVLGATVLLAVGIVTVPATAGAGADEKQKVADAVKWAEKMTGGACDFSAAGRGSYFEIRYRDSGQDQDSPDNVYPLYQLPCHRGADNTTFIYLTSNDHGYALLSFAEPKLDYDYTDESFTRLKAPPQVIGFRTASELGNAKFDAATNSIAMRFKWRGLGDTWSSGEWVFAGGEFLLRTYSVDPTYESGAGNADDAAQPESYQVYPLLKTGSDK